MHSTIKPRVSVSRVSFCSERAVTIAGQTFTPDKYSAYVEFSLAHAFPVVTSDGTALHPQVVANSFQSLFHKVFNLGHLMRAYGETGRDRILGTIVAVEFPNTPDPRPQTQDAWQVGESKATAPGIRCLAVVHRQAEGVNDVLRTHFNGQVRWTVSMEQEFPVDDTGNVPITSGWIVAGASSLSAFDATTPADLRALGWTYVPCCDAPDELNRCINLSGGDAKVTLYRDRPTHLLFGGVNGSVQFKGTGLTPLGKEAEACVMQMVAGGASEAEIDSALVGIRLLTSAATSEESPLLMPLLNGLRLPEK